MRIDNNELYMGSFKLSDLAREYGTPLYVYDVAGIKDQMLRFKRYFSSEKLNCKIVYASKAFLAPKLCYLLEEHGFYSDSVSYGDLKILEHSNFPLNKVILHGNNKSILELKTAIEKDVLYIVVDNLTELKTLLQLSKQYPDKKIKTLFRVNPGIEALTHAYIQTSTLSSKFGESIFDDAIIKQVLELYISQDRVVLEGFHAHIGSQIQNATSYFALVKAMFEFAKKVETSTNLKISTLDFGGGFGIKYLEDDMELNLKETLTGMVRLSEELNEELNLTVQNIMIEPGRSIIAKSGITLYTCGGLKKTYSSKRYLFIDGGMTDNIRPALYGVKYKIDNCDRVFSEAQKVYDIVGKCCESGDIIALDATMGDVKVGDTLVVYTTGAYGYAMSSNYNGILRPAVLFVDTDQKEVVIKREEIEDLTKTYIF